MRNTLHVLSVEALLRPGTDRDLLDDARESDLDGFGNGAGDPGGLAFDKSGGIALALSGVGEILRSDSPLGQHRRTRAGIRPTAVAFGTDTRSVFAVDTGGDAVLVVGPSPLTIALGPRPEPDAVARGEQLFHDARLSHDHWLSCQSCHTDNGTNHLLADTMGDGSFGTPKLVPPLLGVADTAPWAWSGSMERLEDQVRKSIESTMQGEPPTDAQVADLTAYLRSLPPPPVQISDSLAASRGRRCLPEATMRPLPYAADLYRDRHLRRWHRGRNRANRLQSPLAARRWGSFALPPRWPRRHAERRLPPGTSSPWGHTFTE